MATYKLTVVKHEDVSVKVWAVGGTDPDFLPTRVKEESTPQTHTIHIYMHTHIYRAYSGCMSQRGAAPSLPP